MVVVAPPNRRLDAGGWFARSFLTTAGIVAALMVATVGSCLGLGLLGTVLHDDNLTVDAKRIAMPILRKQGIYEVSRDSVAYRDGSEVIFSGDGRTSSGTIKPYVIRFRVSKFGRDEQWQTVYLSIDGHALTAN